MLQERERTRRILEANRGEVTISRTAPGPSWSLGQVQPVGGPL